MLEKFNTWRDMELRILSSAKHWRLASSWLKGVMVPDSGMKE
jgi:hypothetical protein